MNIMLGDLSVKQIEERLGIEFPGETRDFMNNSHQSGASKIQPGKWHCFDLPFNMVCGDYDTAKKIYESVKDKSEQCKTSLQFSIQE